MSVIRPPYQHIQGRQRYHHVSLFFPRAKKMSLLLPLRMPQNPMKLMTRKFILRNLKMLVWLNGWRLYRIAMATSLKHDIKKNPTMYKLRVVPVSLVMVVARKIRQSTVTTLPNKWYSITTDNMLNAI